MSTVLPFRPLPFLLNRHTQTIVASKVNLRLEPPSVTRFVPLPDGDRIALEVSTPEQWQAETPTVVLVHGLCGCHSSPYMRRLAYKLWRRDIRAVRMNLRGCGSGDGLAHEPYHSGRSEDLLEVLKALQHSTPRSPLTLLGFSLGGNIALKLAGELRAAAAAYLVQVIAVCPPVDLAACVRLMEQPHNRLYEQQFLRQLKAAVARRQAHFPDLPPVDLSNLRSLSAFDERYTAPTCGFRDAHDYYTRCSAAPLLPRITIPCRLLFAADDPFIDSTMFDDVALPPHIEIVRTKRGGHLGFLGTPGHPGGYRWMDALLLEWIRAPRHAPRKRKTPSQA
jgi:predicted alpha/beta-fold hydrolase